jgi:hypothetical protein
LKSYFLENNKVEVIIEENEFFHSKVIKDLAELKQI